MEKHSEQILQQGKAIRWLVVGSLIADYGSRLLDGNKGELKMRANAVKNAVERLQNYFRFHPNATPEHMAIFEKEFLKNEIIAMAELLECVWSMDEDGINEVVKAINRNSVEI